MLRVRTQFTGTSGLPGLSNLYFNGGDTADAQAVATQVAGVWNTMKTRMANQVTYLVEPLVAEMDQATGEIIQLHNVTGGTGTGLESTTPMARATQGLVQLRTGFYLGGREIRGRCFIPGPTVTGSSNGAPAAAYSTFIGATMQALVTGATAGREFVVWSKKNGVTVDIQNCVGWNKWAVLRSRRDG